MGNAIQGGGIVAQPVETVVQHSQTQPERFGVEDFSAEQSPRHSAGTDQGKRVRFQTADQPHNVVLVKANENRSSASSSGYESKSCSSIDENDDNIRLEESSPALLLPCNPAIEDILTCDECGQKFSKSGHYLSHIRRRTHYGCNNAEEQAVPVEVEQLSPKSLAKGQLVDAIRKTKSYNQERDLLWIPPEKLRPKSARPEHRILGPLGNSYLHWLTHLERLDQLSDESSETEEHSPPSTGESTIC